MTPIPFDFNGRYGTYHCEIVAVHQTAAEHKGLVFEWQGTNGWGQIQIYLNETTGQYGCDDDGMGEYFVNTMLNAWIDSFKIE